MSLLAEIQLRVTFVGIKNAQSVHYPFLFRYNQMSSVAILGGGISGLSSAYYLARMAPATTKIILIEGKERVGGWIQSRRVAPDQSREQASTTAESSVLFEAGPRSLRPNGATGAILLEMVKQGTYLCKRPT